MGGQYSALTKHDNGDGTVTIKDTINGTEEVWEQGEWDKGPAGGGKPLSGGGNGGGKGKDKQQSGGFRDSRSKSGGRGLKGWGA